MATSDADKEAKGDDVKPGEKAESKKDDAGKRADAKPAGKDEKKADGKKADAEKKPEPEKKADAEKKADTDKKPAEGEKKPEGEKKGEKQEEKAAVEKKEAVPAAASAATDAHGHEKHEHPNYMKIFWILLVLTIIEIGASYIPHKGLKIFSLSFFAAAKAGLVGLYFMHLKFEKRNLRFVVIVPLILAGILTLALGWESGALESHRYVNQEYQPPVVAEGAAH